MGFKALPENYCAVLRNAKQRNNFPRAFQEEGRGLPQGALRKAACHFGSRLPRSWFPFHWLQCMSHVILPENKLSSSVNLLPVVSHESTDGFSFVYLFVLVFVIVNLVCACLGWCTFLRVLCGKLCGLRPRVEQVSYLTPPSSPRASLRHRELGTRSPVDVTPEALGASSFEFFN